MTQTTDLLNNVQIASPCPASWDAMSGDESRRHCAECKLDVYNLSSMTTQEAEQLLVDAGQGRLCVRLFRREDGTVLTRDCPVGLKQRMRRAWARCAALVGVLFASTIGCTRRATVGVADPLPKQHTTPQQDPQQDPGNIMGEICVEPLQGAVEFELGDVALPPPEVKADPEPSPVRMGRIAVPQEKKTPEEKAQK